MLVGEKNGQYPIFPHSIVENPSISLAHGSAFNGPNNFQFGNETSSHRIVTQQ